MWAYGKLQIFHIDTLLKFFLTWVGEHIEMCVSGEEKKRKNVENH